LSDNQRPNGVATVAILEMLLGIILFTAFVLSFLPGILRHFRPVTEMILLILATVDFALAYGLWTGKGWAWTTALVFGLVGITFSGFMLFVRPAFGQLVSLLIDLLILYYLMQPKVHRHFKGTVSQNKQ
jgi:uncharacterized membrane protein (DUF2068 family)